VDILVPVVGCVIGKGNKDHSFVPVILVVNFLEIAVKNVQFVDDRWCNITIVNIHASAVDEDDNTENTFIRN
jgi:hypothetical protein